VIAFVLFVILFLNLLLLYQIIVNSFKTADDYNGAGEYQEQGINVFGPPRQWSLESFEYFFRETKAMRAFLNNAILSIACVVLLLLIGSLTALILAQYRVWFSEHIVRLLIGAQAIPIVMTILTTFQITRSLGWLDSYQGAIVALTAQFLPFTIFLFYSYYLDLPRELLDAAEVDGASFRQIFLQIVLPMSKSIAATVGILMFVFTWATYLIGLVVLRSEDMYILSMVIQNMEIALRLRIPVLFAAFVVFALPMLLVAYWAQRYISAGMLAGSLKD
jgi:ABC-type glycerol-3-phosphate transport system permease component